MTTTQEEATTMPVVDSIETNKRKADEEIQQEFPVKAAKTTEAIVEGPVVTEAPVEETAAPAAEEETTTKATEEMTPVVEEIVEAPVEAEEESVEEEEEIPEKKKKAEGSDIEEEEEEDIEEDLAAIDKSNIIEGGRRTRGKKVDFKAILEKEGEEDEDDEDDE